MPRPTQKIYGRRLGDLRRKARLTQKTLGERVKLGEGRIGQIEQREIDGISPDRIPLFAEALKVSEEVFLAQLAVTKSNGTPMKRAAKDKPPKGESPS